jgi:transcriptional regulator with XRE-family HTH domain
MKSNFSFNLAVRKLMRRQKMKQTEMASMLGVTARTVSDTISRGQPTITTCEKYAAALGVTLTELISEGYI